MNENFIEYRANADKDPARLAKLGYADNIEQNFVTFCDTNIRKLKEEGIAKFIESDGWCHGYLIPISEAYNSGNPFFRILYKAYINKHLWFQKSE